MNTTTTAPIRISTQIRKATGFKVQHFDPVLITLNSLTSNWPHHLKRRTFTEEADVEITVNWEVLFDLLGSRAVHSKGGKAVEAGGAITARVVGSRTVVSDKVTDNPIPEGAHIVKKL